MTITRKDQLEQVLDVAIDYYDNIDLDIAELNRLSWAKGTTPEQCHKLVAKRQSLEEAQKWFREAFGEFLIFEPVKRTG